MNKQGIRYNVKCSSLVHGGIRKCHYRERMDYTTRWRTTRCKPEKRFEKASQCKLVGTWLNRRNPAQPREGQHCDLCGTFPQLVYFSLERVLFLEHNKYIHISKPLAISCTSLSMLGIKRFCFTRWISNTESQSFSSFLFFFLHLFEYALNVSPPGN